MFLHSLRRLELTNRGLNCDCCDRPYRISEAHDPVIRLCGGGVGSRFVREMMGELTYIHIECSTLLHSVLKVTIHRVYTALEELDVKVGPRDIGTSDLLQDRRNEHV